MGMKLHLGVYDIPYSSEFTKKRIVTTAEVARFLENDYELFEYFLQQKSDLIRNLLINDIRKALKTGKKIDSRLFDFACKKIAIEFKQMINKRGFDSLAGVPTLAAKSGLSKRFKKGRVIYYKSNSPDGSRPSFLDTHTFRDSVVMWIE